MKPHRHISPSSGNRFFNCAFQWRCHYDKGRSPIELDTTARDLGLNVHNMNDIFFEQISAEPTADEIQTLAWNIFDANFNRSLSHVKDKAERCIKNFIKFEKNRLLTWDTYKPTFTEKQLRDDKYLAIIDFYSKEEKTGIDWKTGKLSKLWDSQLRQGKICQTVLNNNNYPCEKFLFVGLGNGRVLEVPRLSDLWLEQQRVKMVKMIRADKFPKNPGSLCDYCGYILDCQLSGECLWKELL